jgi:DNA-binding FadR family transcriptional regulator
VTEAFAPIERRKVYEQVSERLEAELGTTLKAGDALPPERELAERYGVGRSSVREALRMLESRGLIESRGSGTFVVAAWRNPFQEPLSVVVAGEDVDRAQLFEVRRLLEAEAAALARSAGRSTSSTSCTRRPTTWRSSSTPRSGSSPPTSGTTSQSRRRRATGSSCA